MSAGWRRGLSRLRGRSIAELTDRSRQAAIAWLERAGIGDVGFSRAGLRRSLDRALPSRADDWCRAFRQRRGAGFFAGFDDVRATMTAAAVMDPEGSRALVRVATQALEGRFDLLGYRNLSYGQPSDWHRDPVAGITAPRMHWSRLPYLDPEVAGDHKVVWELNRHQWLVSMAQAWHLTSDDRFVVAIGDALDQWMDANPPKAGINWASSLEVAFRAISWLWTFRLLGDATALKDETVIRAVAYLRIAARHLERHLSTWFSPNTHLTGEALALYYLGQELRDLPGAARWRATGRRVLLDWLPVHVRADGTYFEQSTWYHRYTLDFYAHFMLLGERAGDRLSPLVSPSLQRLGEVLLYIRRPDGSMPLIGDDDGGRLLFLDGRTPHDVRPALALAGLATGNAELCAAAEATTETCLLLGATAGARLEQLATRASLPPASRFFPDGGLVVMRDNWSASGTSLVLDAGVHGAMNCGHAHADALSFELSWGSSPVFVDPGTRAYTSLPALRDAFRSTASHNAATVDGRDSSRMTGPFAWGQIASTRVDYWHAGSDGDCLVASHDGFDEAGHHPYAYQRTVMRLPTPAGSAWVVRDTFEARGEATLRAHFQCAPGLHPSLDAGPVLLKGPGRPDLRLFVWGGQTAMSGGEVSPAYGVSIAAARIEVSRSGTGYLSICTVIIEDEVGDPVYEHAPGYDSLVLPLGSTELFVQWGSGGPGDLSFDGVVLWGEREGASGRPSWWRAVGARRVAVAGSPLMESTEPRDARWSAGDPVSNSN